VNNKDPRIITTSILTQPDGQRYIRMIDMADLLRCFAGSLELLDIIDAKNVADEIRMIARQLEGRP